MKINILRCNKCSKYTLKEICSSCKSKTNSTKPAKFSLNDKYGKWRREYKSRN